MTTYTNIFGGNVVRAADQSLSQLALTSNQTLNWPSSGQSPMTSAIIEVTADAAGRTVKMPDARRAGEGETVTFRNFGTYTFTVLDNVGNSIISITTGMVYTVYLRDNTTQAGVWSYWQTGGGSSPADASSLRGAGLDAYAGLLRVKATAQSFSASQAFSDNDRGGVATWTGGSGTFFMPYASNVGNGWYMIFKNAGSGSLQIAASNSETFDGSSNITLAAGEGVTVFSNGINFSYVKYGSTATSSNYSYTSISVAGSGTYTLSAAEYAKEALNFTGLLTGNRNIIVPTAVARYDVTNNTTGSYTLTIKTASGTGVTVTQGKAQSVYCDGTNVVAANTDYPAGLSTPIAVADGGTGATTSAGALTNLGGTTTGSAVFTAANAAAGRSALSAASTGANTFSGDQAISYSNAGAGAVAIVTNTSTATGSNAALYLNVDTVQARFLASQYALAELTTTSNHPLTFNTNNTERMRVAADGKVGIGTSSPGSILSVSQSSTDTTNYYNGARVTIQNASATANNFSTLSFITSNGNDAAAIWSVIGSHTAGSATGSLAFGTSNAAGASTERMRITGGGDVAIGLTSASYKLDVNGGIRTQGWGSAAAGTLIFGNGASTSSIYGNASTLAFFTGGAERARISNSYFGINTDSPGAMLEVANTAPFAVKLNNKSSGKWKSEIQFSNGATDKWSFGVDLSDNGTNDLFWYSGGTKMSLTSGGNLFVSSSIDVGNTDTTITRSEAGVLAVEGGVIPKENRQNVFSVSQTAKTANGGITIIANSEGTSGSDVGFFTARGGSYSSYFSQYGSGYAMVATEGTTLDLKTVNSAPVVLSTNSTERVRIDSSGNVGIGTTSPSSKLHVVGTVISSGTGLSASFSMKNTTGARDWRVMQKDDGSFYITDETASAERVKIDSNGNVDIPNNVRVTGGGSLGYGTGSGGTVTQTTNKTTGVTLNKTNGKITTTGTQINGSATIDFTVANNTVAATDCIILNRTDNGTITSYDVWVKNVVAGSFDIAIRNNTAGALSNTLTFNFAVIKAVTS